MSDVYEPLDLGFGRCRLVVARLKGALGDAGRSSTIRVATRYPTVAARHFLERGVSAEVVRLAGSVELAPGLGLADCIVDVVETGRTLEDNGLVAAEEIALSSARLVVNRASYHASREELARLLEILERASA
jgi:ATP phosphoribosyltransferase